jgi:hypothetical protein
VVHHLTPCGLEHFVGERGRAGNEQVLLHDPPPGLLPTRKSPASPRDGDSPAVPLLFPDAPCARTLAARSRALPGTLAGAAACRRRRSVFVHGSGGDSVAIPAGSHHPPALSGQADPRLLVSVIATIVN